MPSTSPSRSSRRVIEALDRARGPMTRSEIGESAALSRPTVAQVVANLERGGFIRSVRRRGPSETGRTPDLFVLTERAGVVVAVDIGHRGFRVAIGTGGGDFVTDGGTAGAPLRKGQLAEIDTLGPHVLDLAAELAASMLARVGLSEADVRGVGVGLPAPLLGDLDRILGASFMPGWGGVDVTKKAAAAFQQRLPADDRWTPRVFVCNDANAAALGQSARGPARGRRDFLYLKVSSGIGAGIVANGQLVGGGRGVAGEFGHLAVPAAVASLPLPGGLPPFAAGLVACPRCGKPDCVELLASGDALLRMVRARAPGYADVDMKTMVRDAREAPEKHPVVNAALGYVGAVLGHSLGQALAFLDPEIIVVGGVLSDAGPVLLEPIRETLTHLAIGPYVPRVEAVTDRSDAGLRGAIAIALANTAPRVLARPPR